MNYNAFVITLLLGVTVQTHVAANEVTMDHGAHMPAIGAMMDQKPPLPAPPHNETAPLMTKGLVTRIDPNQHKIGIKHEAIGNLNMPPMTMVFAVVDPALLQGLTVGDAITFHAIEQAGALQITTLQRQ